MYIEYVFFLKVFVWFILYFNMIETCFFWLRSSSSKILL